MDRIVLLPGDGIGPEVTREAKRVLEATAAAHGQKLEFEEALIGGASIDAHGDPLRTEVVELCRGSRAVFLGAVGGPKWDAMPVDTRPEKGLLRIRKELGLFANLRPATKADKKGEGGWKSHRWDPHKAPEVWHTERLNRMD